MSQRQRNSQSGMTLVELMVALVISSIVVFFLFSIQTRMSRAYQGQGTVSEINQNLRAAKQMLINDMRMAGYGLSTTGFVDVASTINDGTGLDNAVDDDGNLIVTTGGVVVANNAYGDGNDSFRILYTDPSGEIVVTNMGPVFADTEDPVIGFADDEPVIITTKSVACLVAVTGVNPNKVHFNPNTGGQPYNEAPQNKHCDRVRRSLANGEPVTIQRFVARSYRIDPNRASEGYLQMSPSGETSAAPDWIDMGVGFTNLQLASRYYEEGDLVDADGDGDTERDWYSGDNQSRNDPSGVRPADAVLVQVSLSIEGRSPFGTRGAAASVATPAFVDLTNVDNNSLGDWGQACPSSNTDPCGLDLANTPDSSRTGIYARYVGEYIYRYTTSIIDLRNMGIGQ